MEGKEALLHSSLLFLTGFNANHRPGASSMLGLLLENGPLNIDVNGNAVQNNFSWDQLVDYIWVDQPVYA